ncbi:MAG: hypothetical protein HY553_21495 [Elusimicrobia bacterium]|nr:hypothetical protein [Elusimicrobiota bacterium]
MSDLASEWFQRRWREWMALESGPWIAGAAIAAAAYAVLAWAARPAPGAAGAFAWPGSASAPELRRPMEAPSSSRDRLPSPGGLALPIVARSSPVEKALVPTESPAAPEIGGIRDADAGAPSGDRGGIAGPVRLASISPFAISERSAAAPGGLTAPLPAAGTPSAAAAPRPPWNPAAPGASRLRMPALRNALASRIAGRSPGRPLSLAGLAVGDPKSPFQTRGSLPPPFAAAPELPVTAGASAGGPVAAGPPPGSPLPPSGGPGPGSLPGGGSSGPLQPQAGAADVAAWIEALKRQRAVLERALDGSQSLLIRTLRRYLDALEAADAELSSLQARTQSALRTFSARGRVPDAKVAEHLTFVLEFLVTGTPGKADDMSLLKHVRNTASLARQGRRRLKRECLGDDGGNDPTRCYADAVTSLARRASRVPGLFDSFRAGLSLCEAPELRPPAAGARLFSLWQADCRARLEAGMSRLAADPLPERGRSRSSDRFAPGASTAARRAAELRSSVESKVPPAGAHATVGKALLALVDAERLLNDAAASYARAATDGRDRATAYASASRGAAAGSAKLREALKLLRSIRKSGGKA